MPQQRCEQDAKLYRPVGAVRVSKRRLRRTSAVLVPLLAISTTPMTRGTSPGSKPRVSRNTPAATLMSDTTATAPNSTSIRRRSSGTTGS
jgi:hypothetical protein